MWSALSAGTSRAPDFNQAARNVACIANLVSQSDINVASFTRLGFVLLAPASRISEGVFAAHMNRDAICAAVTKRAQAFDSDAVRWCAESFQPIAQRFSVVALSWEDVLSQIDALDASTAHALRHFYVECLRHNLSERRSVDVRV